MKNNNGEALTPEYKNNRNTDIKTTEKTLTPNEKQRKNT